MADIFEEVEEQLRSERYRALAMKILPWAAGVFGAAVVLSIGLWTFDHYRTEANNKASEQYSQGLEALQAGQVPQATQIFSDVSKSSSRGYKALALQQLGGIKLVTGETAQAVKLFDEAAAAAPDDIIGDAARLKSAFALLDTAPLKDMEARLTPMLKEGRPYRTQAREALAFAKLLAGDTKGARDDYILVSLLPDAEQSARERAGAAKALIDSGSAKAVPSAVKAALAMPVPPTIPGLSAPPLQVPSAP